MMHTVLVVTPSTHFSQLALPSALMAEQNVPPNKTRGCSGHCLDASVSLAPGKQAEARPGVIGLTNHKSPAFFLFAVI